MMIFQVLGPAICAACNILGGAGVGYEYKGVGVSMNWVYRQVGSGAVDYDTLMPALSYQALTWRQFSVGPYVGKTFTLDGKPHPSTWASGIMFQWTPGRK